MRNKENNWQRLEAVINWAHMSTNYFARYIGLPRGENLYQIKRGNNGISFDVADKIVARFPEISKFWLLTGEGDMIVSENRSLGNLIPYYNADVEQNIAKIDTLESIGDLVVPPVGSCDLAMHYSGRAMGSVVPPGTVVFLKSVDRDAIIPGSEYVIISRKFVTLRIVRAAEEEGKFRLVAGDREHFDDIVLDASDIVSVYMVTGKLIVNS